MNRVTFLPKHVVLRIHKELINMYGGSHGVQDENLLDSALEQPQTTLGGFYLHKSLVSMAATYGYHICQNHPFIDGNKRVALMAMNMFLIRNGFEITASEKDTFLIMMSLASSELTKEALEEWLKKNVSEIK